MFGIWDGVDVGRVVDFRQWLNGAANRRIELFHNSVVLCAEIASSSVTNSTLAPIARRPELSASQYIVHDCLEVDTLVARGTMPLQPPPQVRRSHLDVATHQQANTELKNCLFPAKAATGATVASLVFELIDWKV